MDQLGLTLDAWVRFADGSHKTSGTNLFRFVTSTLHSTTTEDSDSACVNTKEEDTALRIETASKFIQVLFRSETL